MKYLNLLPFIAVLFVAANTFSQTPADKIVSLTVSGQGKTSADAQQVALRSAIEQAFGAFISSKTEILNDQMVSDQITSISSGNIQSFKVLAEAQLPSGDWAITLTAIVSVTKLTSFVQAKGVSVDIQGELFAMNILQQELNEKSELLAVKNMVTVLRSYLKRSLDFEIQVGQPVAEESKWKLLVEVTGKANKNMSSLTDYLLKTLSALSMTESEILDYKKLKKGVYVVDVFYEPLKTVNENPYYRLNKNGKYVFRPLSKDVSEFGWAYCYVDYTPFPAKVFFLRNQFSLAELEGFFDFCGGAWLSALQNFKIESGVDQIMLNRKTDTEAKKSKESTVGQAPVILKYGIQNWRDKEYYLPCEGSYGHRPGIDERKDAAMDLIYYLEASTTLGLKASTDIHDGSGNPTTIDKAVRIYPKESREDFKRWINSENYLVSKGLDWKTRWNDEYSGDKKNLLSLCFPVEGEHVVRIKWNDIRSLDELKQMKKYTISPLEK